MILGADYSPGKKSKAKGSFCCVFFFFLEKQLWTPQIQVTMYINITLLKKDLIPNEFILKDLINSKRFENYDT